MHVSDVQVRPEDAPSGRQPSARVREIIARLSLEEKLAQISGHWVDHGGNVVAPMADVMGGGDVYDEATRLGIGHLTRVYGTHPVEPGERRAARGRQHKRGGPDDERGHDRSVAALPSALAVGIFVAAVCRSQAIRSASLLSRGLVIVGFCCCFETLPSSSLSPST